MFACKGCRCLFIVPITNTGTTSRALAKYRPQVPIYALTESLVVARKLLLVWGVIPIEVASLSDTDAMLAQVSSILKNEIARVNRGHIRSHRRHAASCPRDDKYAEDRKGHLTEAAY